MKYAWSILQETPHWIAINKPSMLNVEPVWDYPNVQDQVLHYLRTTTGRQQPYVGIVHRLDRPVSGVLLLAKKKQMLRLLNEQFAQRQVDKTYWAICNAPPPRAHDTVEHHLLKQQKQKRSVVFASARKATSLVRLTYRVIASLEGQFLLEVRPHTGKFHQIRVQLAAIGCPIVGDWKYGSTVADAMDSIALHARSLHFTYPLAEDQKIVCHAPVPVRQVWKTFRQEK